MGLTCIIGMNQQPAPSRRTSRQSRLAVSSGSSVKDRNLGAN